MRFIMIETSEGEAVAVNPSSIKSISRSTNNSVILSFGDSIIYTKFTDIQSAVDYVQRASSISLGAPNLNGRHIPGGV